MIVGICDDEKVCIDMTYECCEKLKEDLGLVFKYKIFNSGEQVLECKEEIDILFLDVELTGINGLETMKLLENRANVKHIVFMSGHSNYVYID